MTSSTVGTTPPGATRALTMLALVAIAVAAIAPAAPALGPPVVRPAFTWTMPARFGFDADRDGRIDLPNTPEYVAGVSPGSCADGPCTASPYLIVLDASATTAILDGRALPVTGYHWEITGDGIGHPLRYSTVSPRLTAALREGDYQATLTAVASLPDGGTVTGRATGPVAVDDLLVVALGDSYASGEGNPEVRRDGESLAVWADGATVEAEAAHHAAHRSSVAWPVQAALRLEALDPRTSVTFVSVATSGAMIDRGILHAQTPRSTTSQIDQAAALVGSRQVDLVLLSVGGNDVGFGKMIHGLVDADRLLDPLCYGVDLGNVFASVLDGDWNRTSKVYVDLGRARIGCRSELSGDGGRLPGLDGLTDAFDRLAAAIEERLDPATVLVTEYPDPTGATDGTCGEIVGDTTPPFRFHEIDAAEADTARERVLRPLNTAIADAARAHGWVMVRHLVDSFANGHGYCGTWPDYGYPEAYTSRPSWLTSRLDYPDAWYAAPDPAGPPPEVDGPGVSWYRTAAQSAALQGPDSRTDTSGTLHPNELGHRAIAVAVVGALRARGLP